MVALFSITLVFTKHFILIGHIQSMTYNSMLCVLVLTAMMTLATSSVLIIKAIN